MWNSHHQAEPLINSFERVVVLSILYGIFNRPFPFFQTTSLPDSIYINMASSRLFFIFALLAALALAAPSQVRRGLAKRSFKVPRQLNKAHPTGPNGPAAMRKVFRKYNFVVKDDFATFSKQAGRMNVTTAAAGGNKTGTVAANPEQNAALFLSPVDVGGQMLNLDFDSGSSDL